MAFPHCLPTPAPRHTNWRLVGLLGACLPFLLNTSHGQAPAERVLDTPLSYHALRVSATDGSLLPWPGGDLGKSYDEVMQRVWRFWRNLGADRAGHPYFMMHQVWSPAPGDDRGAGGDQFAMALSSLREYHAYTGDPETLAMARRIADYYLERSLSPATAAWPRLPFPYNTQVYVERYDGDMVLGPGYTQPDKAGSFGWELLQLYRTCGEQRYLQAARDIADTLALQVQAGDEKHSPWPFKVNALTGETGKLLRNGTEEPEVKELTRHSVAGGADYTTNYAGTLELFLGLQELGVGDRESYARAFQYTLDWMRRYPLNTMRWGPFFEDVPGWSDTQINAVTFASFILEHPELFPDGPVLARRILDWVEAKLRDDTWAPYGVWVVREQTAWPVPGNSHTARQGATELRYAEITGDKSRTRNAIRQLSWATYMVDADGKNCYPTDAVWLTDGYGDYLRHYLRAMAADPRLAPTGSDHLLRSSSPLTGITYGTAPMHRLLHYASSSNTGNERLRLQTRPVQILLDGRPVSEGDASSEVSSCRWLALPLGGVLELRRIGGCRVELHYGP